MVGPLVVDDFDGAKLKSNHLPGTALCAWQQQQGLPTQISTQPPGHREQPTRARRSLWQSYICPAAVGSVRLPPPRHDTAANPNKWSVRLLLPGWRAFS